MRPWFNGAAVEWAMDAAPSVPSRLASTLFAVASYVGADGQGAYPSAATVAAITRKSESQAKRDIAELLKLGLLRSGDWRLVKDIRADKRPNVYDLPDAGRDYIGRHRKQRGASGRTPQRGASEQTPPDSRGASRDGTGRISPQNGVRLDAPEEFYEKNSEDGARPARFAGAAGDAPQTPPVADGAPVDRAALLAETKAKLAATARTGPRSASERHPSAVSSSLICRRCGGSDHDTEGCTA